MPNSADLRRMMVDTQIRPADVTKFPIIEAMLSIERERFVPAIAQKTAYADAPVPLGGGRMMLEPRTLAKMLDGLAIEPTEMVLDVAAGLGYSAAVIACLAEAVIAVEEVAALADEAEANLSDASVDNVAVVTALLSEGAPKPGFYDAILIDGGVELIPETMLEQLKEDGRIAAVFMDGALGTCRIGLKTNGIVSWRDAFNASAEILPGFRREVAFHL